MALIDRSFREKIVLVGTVLDGQTDQEVEDSLDELAMLVDTAGADVATRVVQRRHAPDPTYYVGKGKAEELRLVSHETDCDTVVFDDELTPAQQFNLEKLLGRTAIDRTAVILDIFAQNAHSREGKAQVELAQHRYRLPRLRGKGSALSQQAGGIGTRGPGETQLETDRRRLLRRIHKLEAELRVIVGHRHTQRKARRRSQRPVAAIVGYTNGGKSTLLNALTDAGVLVEDRLFATLDATTRRVLLPGGAEALLVDTVGFVRKLPHQLVEAFRSTLEVIADADLVVHLVDATAVDPDAHMAAVRTVLRDIDAGGVPELLVFNKADVAPDAKRLADLHVGAVAVSAATGEGLDRLVDALAAELVGAASMSEFLVPFERGDVRADLHATGAVVLESSDADGMRLHARLDDESRARFSTYLVH